MLFDLHMHSNYSYDSFNNIKDILKTAKLKGLSGIAITDHDEFQGSIEASKIASNLDLLVIPGMEVATDEGDLICLFIKEEIKSKSFLDVINEVKEQEGITLLPHPYKRKNKIEKYILENIDLIEVFNARGESIGNNNCNNRAYETAMKSDIPISAGSDAHFLFEIGRGNIDIGKCLTLDDVKNNLLNRKNKINCVASSKYVEVYSQFIKAYKKNDISIYKSSIIRLLRTLKYETLHLGK